MKPHFCNRCKERETKQSSVEIINEGKIGLHTRKEFYAHPIDDNKLVGIGLMLIKVVKQIDLCFAGMILITYCLCIFQSTATLYNALTIFFGTYSHTLMLSCVACFSLALLCMYRLFLLTVHAYGLSKSMKECSYQLDWLKFKKKVLDYDGIDLLKQDIKYWCESPISPFTAFSVSPSTFIGLCGVITTYLIVLLQFKVSEPL